MRINQAEATDKYKNSNSENELVQVDNTYWVELNQSLNRLYKNRDFKKLILEGYFKDKAISGVSLLASEYVKKSNLRSDVMEQLIGISQLEDYFLVIKDRAVLPDNYDEEEGQ